MVAQEARYKKLFPSIAAVLFIAIIGVIILINGIPLIGWGMVPVVFSLDAPDASSVAVVGDFNQWNPKSNLLVKGENVWSTEILLKKGNTYLYNFLIDGDKWITDPTQMNIVVDSFGTKSVLEL